MRKPSFRRRPLDPRDVTSSLKAHAPPDPPLFLPMKTLDEVMSALEAKGSEQTRKTLRRHGAVDPFFGVKVGDLKPIAKKLKDHQDLALELFATNNGDAQYLAGIVADGSRMTKAQLNTWARTATWGMISGTTVPWVATEHPAGIDLALKWIDTKKVAVARAGWGTLCGLVTVRPDEELPIPTLKSLLDRVVREIHAADGDIAYMMNNYVICVGTYVAPLADAAITAARKIGKVEIDMGETSCKVPDAEPYMLKSRRDQPVAPKRKTFRC